MTRGRVLVVGVLVLAAAAVGYVVLSGSQTYCVKADFVNASQLVKGNLVTVAGQQVGSVENIQLTDDGKARVTFTVNADYAPLREGTRATIRLQSLSGVANRYVDLQLGGGDKAQLPEGGVIPTFSTEAAVDLDQVFNLFDPKAREGTRRTIRLFKEFNAGREEEANAAFRYLNPALAASSRLFGELNRNRSDFERFIVQNARLVTDISARDDDLAGLIVNLGTTMDALARERDALGDTFEKFPNFMRRTSTTFRNLRGTLDELDPLVEDSKPIVRKRLRPLFAELRPFARDAEPTVRDLSRTIRQPGRDNDLIEFLQAQPAVDRIANETAQRNGERRPGAFRATQLAMPGATRQFSFFRPYSPDFLAWLDDFSTTGGQDALGGFSRSGLALSGFTLGPSLEGLPEGSAARDQLLDALPPGAVRDNARALIPVPPELREEVLAANTETGRNNRCPGSAERTAADGSNPFRPTPDFNCDPRQTPPGR